ncbi:MAG: hypothetical protein PVJ92_03185, partial [Candidatus Dependentiae bacterium]
DEYAFGEGRLKELLRRFEEKLHVRVLADVALPSEPAFVETVHGLLADNAAGQVSSHAPPGVWTAPDLSLQRFDEPGTEVPLLSPDMMMLLRNCLVSFATSARRLRAALHNRYLGNSEAVALLRLRAHAEPLQAALRDMRMHVLEPLLRHLTTAGQHLTAGTEAEEGRFDEWCAELAHIRAVAQETEHFLTEL